ncbi:MAG: beta-propeller repeat protein [Frankiales bacterium]|nr:beta-propeller repeat protein [Frankiales bacterium]
MRHARGSFLAALAASAAVVSGCTQPAPPEAAPRDAVQPLSSTSPMSPQDGVGPHLHTPPPATGTAAPGPRDNTTPTPLPRPGDLPGMPPLLDPGNVYAAAGPRNFAPATRSALSLVYVPNGVSNSVHVIDPVTFRVIDRFAVGKLPQHVVPSYDLKTLWVTNDKSNSLTAIDPTTGKPSRTVPVDDPYNLYFSPDGRFAMVMAEALQRIDFRDPRTMAIKHRLFVSCKGVDHGDFTADGRLFVASCEFVGKMVVVDVQKQRVTGYIDVGRGNMPQDVKLSPDGTTFYVADMRANGVWVIDAKTLKLRGRIPTGKGAHGITVSRDSKSLYVSNRDEGSVSVIDLASRKVRTKWLLPKSSGGQTASPDMGNISADGVTLWLSGRYDAEVYAIDTRTGKLRARIPVGLGPHGLCVWPQPGRYSLGHTGVMR